MNELSATEEELLFLFEQEPERSGIDDVWFFDDSVYRSSDGEIELTCAIHPCYKDVRVLLWSNGREIYEFGATGIKDIQVSSELLLILIDTGETINITLKPNISLKHERPNKT